MVHHGSLVRLPQIDPKPNEDVDGFTVLASAGENLTVKIHTSAKTTGIGKWLLVMKTTHGRRRLPYVKVSDSIVMIFNPWSKFDPVYMKTDEWKNEYILNDDGMLFYGNTNRIGSMDWYFGQFEADVMKAGIKLLHMGYLRYKDHSDPVAVARHMSGLVNSNDDDGVLEGNWSGDYDDGKRPTDWGSSVSILKQFIDTGMPVKYGQCWVFSAVLTSVLRCLGIPCRSLTNFESAHDTDANLTVDYHYDVDSKPMDNDDSIWNFHVWNDVWMAREDLPDGFGGWQALDATPQEESDRKFQCGPMSINAIKEGHINLDYDGAFIYAEVNGTKKYWKQLKEVETDENGRKIEWEELSSESASIGQHISTKQVGKEEREDITNQYKYKEGSKEENLSFEVARKYVRITRTARKEVKKVIEINTGVPSSIKFGQDLSFNIKVKNVSKSSQNVFINVVAKTMQYNGSLVAQILDTDFHKQISGSKTEEFEVSLPSKTYLAKMKGDNNVKFFFLGGVEGGSQTFATQAILEFEKPTIDVEISGTPKLLKNLKVKASFTNPLSVALEGGVFRFEGAGIKDAVVAPVDKVKANAVCKVEVNIQPRKVGSRRIIVGFSSKQLQAVRGSVDIVVA
ncbi:protein-glutamine gamma-glutamyltransferase K-like isoform X2 [Clavelina lepadiformis]